jgi:hypothetical protein
MYTAYFLNQKTGEIKHTSSPCDNPHDNGWIQISYEQYEQYSLVFAQGIRECLKATKILNN